MSPITSRFTEAHRKELEEFGFVVIRNAVPKAVCLEIQQSFLDYMDQLCPHFEKDNKATWIPGNLPVMVGDLMQQYNVAFQRHAIQTRMAVKHLFEDLYDTKELWTSIDGTSFSKRGPQPKLRDLEHWKQKSWETTALHIDHTSLGGKSNQGGLAVVDQREDGHVYTCVPRSQRYHYQIMRLGLQTLSEQNAEIVKRNKANSLLPKGERKSRTALKRLEVNWMVMDKRQLEFLQNTGLEVVRVPMNAGDFIIWDSRLVHRSTKYCRTAPLDAWRLQVFACMCPAPMDPSEIVTQLGLRNKAYAEGLVARHSPDKIRLFDKKPRLRCTADADKHHSMYVPDSAEMSLEEKRLHGLVLYPSQMTVLAVAEAKKMEEAEKKNKKKKVKVGKE